MNEMKERIARAIAKRNGDDFDSIPSGKYEWIAERGQFGGRYRDVNEPMQCDYLDMAEGAIEGMRSPTGDMLIAGMLAGLAANEPAAARHAEVSFEHGMLSKIVAGDGRLYKAAYEAMLDEALK